MIVLVQGDQGRTVLNDTLTHSGVLSALRSKNVRLNSIIAGPLLADGVTVTGDPGEPLGTKPGFGGAEFDWAPVFDLVPYGLDDDIYVLGVESDVSQDDFLPDGQHVYHAFDTDAHSVPGTLPTTESDALQISYNGSNTGASGLVGSGKSILIGEKFPGGIGGGGSDDNQYRAKAIPHEFSSLKNSSGGAISGATKVADPNQSVFLSDSTLGTFTFPFFDSSQPEAYINLDGTITFAAAMNDGENIDWTIDSPSTPPAVAALWDDLSVASDGSSSIFWQVAGSGASSRLIVQWDNFVYAGDVGDQDQITFQAVLYANGAIHFNYVDLDSYPDNNSESTIENTGGVGATVGIWSGEADSLTLPAGKFVPGPHSIQTDSSGETSDSYIRMAWDTGGAAWDVGVVDRFGATSLEANGLRDAFISSLVGQINRAAAAGKTFRSGESVVMSINYGGNAITSEGFAADTDDTANTQLDRPYDASTQAAIPSRWSVRRRRRSMMNSIRRVPATKAIRVKNDINWTLTLEPGTYVVELYFAEIDAQTFSPQDARVRRDD